MDGEYLVQLYSATRWVLLGCLCLLLSMMALSVGKVGLRNFDKSAISIMSVLFVSIACKTTSVFLQLDGSYTEDTRSLSATVDTVYMLADMVLWSLLVYFMLQMRAVADLVRSTTPEEH